MINLAEYFPVEKCSDGNLRPTGYQIHDLRNERKRMPKKVTKAMQIQRMKSRGYSEDALAEARAFYDAEEIITNSQENYKSPFSYDG